nr:MAG TPA: hypothetical protein [Caudoviricetes sp.]
MSLTDALQWASLLAFGVVLFLNSRLFTRWLVSLERKINSFRKP